MSTNRYGRIRSYPVVYSGSTADDTQYISVKWADAAIAAKDKRIAELEAENRLRSQIIKELEKQRGELETAFNAKDRQLASCYDRMNRADAERDALKALLIRCRDEMLLGRHPHMIIRVVDAALAAKGE